MDNKKTFRIDIDGMSCGHCVATVRAALEKCDGVDVREVVIGRAVVDLDETIVTIDQVASAIDDTGFVVRAGS